MTEKTWFGILYLVLGIVCIGLSLPLLAGCVPRNRWYGFRIPKAYETEQAWLLINRYGARHLMRWSSVIAALGAFLLVSDDIDQVYLMWFSLGTPFLLVIPIVQTLLYARRLP